MKNFFMKCVSSMKWSLIFLSLFHAESSHAFSAFCELFSYNSRSDDAFENKANHLLYKSVLDLNCRFLGGGFGPIKLSMYGPGFQINNLDFVNINCPFVTKERIAKVVTKKGSWSAVGAGVSAGGGLISARAGFGINHRGAFCTVAGLGLISLGAAGGAIIIEMDEEVRSI